MASSKNYLQFVLEQLSELDEITYRTMMGEFIIYYRGKIIGGIYDDRLLVKPTKSAIAYMTDPVYEVPYEGAKEMLLVEEVDGVWGFGKDAEIERPKALQDAKPTKRSYRDREFALDRKSTRLNSSH